eukprot:GFUD01058046.1.p1 GENE.GFUD01058046.1~~GFUD01058046.1.p1  ORF type:complete len:142 (-),score=23.89 GFUD01058046.1:98-523(-)
MLPLLVLAATAIVTCKKVKIGNISTLHHAVSGELYALDDKTLMVKNFNYDGAGPDTFFRIGKEGTPENTNEDTTAILAHLFEGRHYEYRNQDAPILKAASNEDLTLILPENIKVSEIKWLSVYDRKFDVDFGNLMFPENIQ